MKLFTPSADELLNLREDPLLVEQELDVLPDVATAVGKSLGIRSGRIYWRSGHDYLYALELADLGKDRPSWATVYGFWDRYEPRPPEHEIDADLVDFLTWFAGLTGGIINPRDVTKVAEFTRQQTGRCQTTWPAGSVVRTPEERFAAVPGFDYPPRYTEIEGLRMAYYETGTGEPILCLHGEPTWAYLYRRMMPVLSRAGRVIVPDLIGFGRSDKPVDENAYSYKSHVRWMKKFITALDLRDITIVAQDWGGSIGLRLVAEMPERFRRIVMMNTGIANGMSPGPAFFNWRRFSQDQVFLDVPFLIKLTLQRTLTEAEYAAYGAPFRPKSMAGETSFSLAWCRYVPITREPLIT